MRGKRSRIRIAALVALASVSAACDPILGPRTPDANWNVHDTERFSFYVRPGSFAESNVARLGEVLDDQYSVAVATLGLRYTGRISVFLYNSAADGDLESDLGGSSYPDTETFAAVCVPPLGDDLYHLLSHEANHVIVANALGRARTYFVTEGLASALLSERFGAIGPTSLYAWTRTNLNAIPPIGSLADDEKWNDFPSGVAYKSSASFLAYLIETSGPQKLRQLYYATSSEFQRRFEEIYGRPLETAEAEWKTFCASR